MDDDARKPKRRARRKKPTLDAVAEQELHRKGGPPGQRRISLGQFRFLRAVVFGMPLRAAADRFLEPETDLRKVQSELRWLRTELLAAARRAHAYGDARALQLDIARIPTGHREQAPSSALTLEDFRERFDPDGFYSEAELLQHYREQHPPTPAADRRAGRVTRLQDRQKRALDTLEHVLVQPPTLADPPSAWLEPATARRIEAVGLKSLEQLVDWIRIRGHRWYSRIPKAGPVAAARVIAWIDRNQDALGVALGPRERFSRPALVAAWRGSRRPETRIVPLERLAVPLELDGSAGTNRLQGVSRLGAENDRQAIEAWIAARAGDNPNTARAYRREAERLLLWAIFERRRPMSSLTVEDAIAYREFLGNPQPAERWIKARRETPMRLSPDWRPFNGPLSQQSAGYAITVLGALFDWLVRQHYLAHNIFGALPRRASGTAAAEADPDRLPDERGRFLTQAQWAVLRSVLPGAGGDEADLRARFAVVLAYTTGLRRSELADARVGRLKVELSEPDDEQDGGVDEPIRRVSLQVLGKGGKPRSVPIVPGAEQLLNDYLASRGLPDWIACQQQGLNAVRLIGHLNRRRRPKDEDSPAAGKGARGGHSSAAQALSDKMVYLIVGEALERAEQLMRKKGMNKDAETFARASTHWLRHTFGRHAMAGGVQANIVQAVLGHASLATTTRYTSADSDEAWDAVQKFTKKRL